MTNTTQQVKDGSSTAHDHEPYVRTAIAARMLGITPLTLRRLALCGRVPAIRVGVVMRFRVGEVAEALKLVA